MAQLDDQIDTWLNHFPDPRQQDPLHGMRQAGLLVPAPDYATIARIKATLTERTGLLGISGIWGGVQLVGRHFIRGYGTEAQQAEWFGRPVSVAISEPKVGAHPKLLTTTAVQDGDTFRLTGQKAWVSNGPSADAIIVFAITAEDQGRKRYSAFLVPRDTPGLRIGEMPGFHALRPSRHCLLTLDDCRVPAAAILGAMGTAYERMALPFRDVEDAVGSFATLGALRHAIRQFASGVSQPGVSQPGASKPGAIQAAAVRQKEGLGAIVGLIAVFAAGAGEVVAALDAGYLGAGDATLVGLRLLALDIVTRLRALAAPGQDQSKQRLGETLSDLDATLAIAKGPRLLRQAHLGEAVAALR
jgi:acyl-CoA dehydrogenase